MVITICAKIHHSRTNSKKVKEAPPQGCQTSKKSGQYGVNKHNCFSSIKLHKPSHEMSHAFIGLLWSINVLLTPK